MRAVRVRGGVRAPAGVTCFRALSVIPKKPRSERPVGVRAAVDLRQARHVGYGVQAQHYDTVGAALLWTPEQGLGSAFTDETKAAWAAAYGTLASVMKEAAYAPA